MSAQVNIVVSSHLDREGVYLKLTTWGFKSGVYGSLGVVRVRTGALDVTDDLQELARMVLTSLYGLDYDL
jgi:hypothetical protein